MDDPTTRVVSVEIQGLRYPIRSALDAGYVAELATYVDAKMQAAMNESPAGESLRLAVLVALNIADEFFRAREAEAATHSELARRAERLERLLDEAIEAVRSPWGGAARPLATPAGSD